METYAIVKKSERAVIESKKKNARKKTRNMLQIGMKLLAIAMLCLIVSISSGCSSRKALEEARGQVKQLTAEKQELESQLSQMKTQYQEAQAELDGKEELYSSTASENLGLRQGLQELQNAQTLISVSYETDGEKLGGEWRPLSTGMVFTPVSPSEKVEVAVASKGAMPKVTSEDAELKVDGNVITFNMGTNGCSIKIGENVIHFVGNLEK